MDFLHPAFLFHAKRTTALAVAAVQAGVSFGGQLGIVVGGDAIAGLGQIVILIHKTNVNARRAWLAVIAVDAGSGNGIGGESTNDGIVLFFLGCLQKFQHLVKMFQGLHTGHSRKNTGPVNGILQTLGQTTSSIVCRNFYYICSI